MATIEQAMQPDLSGTDRLKEAKQSVEEMGPNVKVIYQLPKVLDEMNQRVALESEARLTG